MNFLWIDKETLSMARYLVQLQVLMIVRKEILANNEQKAIDTLFDALVDNTLKIDLKGSPGQEIEDWEAIAKIASGGDNHTAEAKEILDEYR